MTDDIKKFVEEKTEGTKRHFDVVIDMRLAALETTLEAVNLPMVKQKVIGLEKRVEILGSKLRLA